jgi:hypothetical protein
MAVAAVAVANPDGDDDSLTQKPKKIERKRAEQEYGNLFTRQPLS